MFSIAFEVDVGSWGVHIAKAKCQQHFAETGNLTELKQTWPWDVTTDGLF